MVARTQLIFPSLHLLRRTATPGYTQRSPRPIMGNSASQSLEVDSPSQTLKRVDCLYKTHCDGSETEHAPLAYSKSNTKRGVPPCFQPEEREGTISSITGFGKGQRPMVLQTMLKH